MSRRRPSHAAGLPVVVIRGRLFRLVLHFLYSIGGNWAVVGVLMLLGLLGLGLGALQILASFRPD